MPPDACRPLRPCRGVEALGLRAAADQADLAAVAHQRLGQRRVVGPALARPGGVGIRGVASSTAGRPGAKGASTISTAQCGAGASPR